MSRYHQLIPGKSLLNAGCFQGVCYDRYHLDHLLFFETLAYQLQRYRGPIIERSVVIALDQLVVVIKWLPCGSSLRIEGLRGIRDGECA
jgi:hypothetical protein